MKEGMPKIGYMPCLEIKGQKYTV